MKDIRLIKLLKTFTKEEIKSFGKFVSSPFLLQTRNTIELYNYLTNLHPDYDSRLPGKQEIFSQLFTGEDYNERKLQNLIFDLTKSAEHFLAHCTFYEDQPEFLLNLSKGYLNKNLHDESNRINKIIEKKLHPTFSPDRDYTSKLKRLTKLKLEYHNENNHLESVTKSIEDIFETSVLQFIFDYVQYINYMNVARHNCEKDMCNRFVQEVLQIVNFKELLNRFEQEDYIKNPNIGLYYYVFKTIDEPDKLNYYYLLKNLFFRNLSGLNREEKYFFFMHLGNYCIQRSESNANDFRKETLNIFKSMFKNDSYSPSAGQNIAVMIYRTMVLFAYSMKDSGWLNKLIQNYADCLPVDHRDNLRHYTYAYLYFLKNEFERSLSCISTVKNNEFHVFKLDVKHLTMQIYYELSSFELAVSTLDAYKHFIDSNKKIPEFAKILYRNFIKFYKKLLRVKYGISKEDPSFIKEEIDNCIKIVSKKWLMEKADELIATPGTDYHLKSLLSKTFLKI
ncbi:MAG: hypothetical protein IPL53_00450 [Ignavibacteria bacterium]|nr:hypothetical protein [Ignavibacteria bacterium]